MPELTPPRLEQFAVLLARDVDPVEAAGDVGFDHSTTRERAARLARERAKRADVKARVVELRRQLHRHNVSIDSLTFEYEEARQMALQAEQPSAAVAATTGKAKLHGLDKSEQINIDNRTVQVMGDVELARRMTMLLERGVNAVDEMPAMTTLSPDYAEYANDQDVI